VEGMVLRFFGTADDDAMDWRTAVVNTGDWELLWMLLVGVGTALLWVLGMRNW
jgi:hypothetical protein